MSLYNKIIDLQKLSQAWDRVRKKRPAAGVDNVTCEQFEEGRLEELKQLQIELKEHRYHVLPVKRVILYQGEKAREIALYAMRDKVIQQSVEAELKKIYENRFSVQTYAYRNNKSALNAVNDIESKIESGEYSYLLKVDISNFFDTIRWPILKEILQKHIKEDDVLFLIEENAISPVLGDNGEIMEKQTGIHQGSGISPILSNIYMMDFDRQMADRPVYYVRYSDDMLLLGKDKEALLKECNSIKIYLNQLGLQLNEKKTVCTSLEAGINFLGYHFSLKGKAIPAKAEQNLEERLETMWLTASEHTIEEKLKSTYEIIGGWEQYFRGEREIHSIFEYVTLVRFSRENMEELKEKRNTVQNFYKDIAIYLSKIWRDREWDKLELLEYEQYYQIYREDRSCLMPVKKALLENYRKYIIDEDISIAAELMQLYTDIGDYQTAAFWMQQKGRLEGILNKNTDISLARGNSKEDIIFDHETAGKVINIFAGREDIFSCEGLGNGGKRQNEMQAFPLSAEKVYEHLCGNAILGTYIQRPNNTVKYIVVDVDISKKLLIENEKESEIYETYLEMALRKTNEIRDMYHSFGLDGYIEYSGCRGYHIWLFFTEWIPVRYANMFCDVIERKIGNNNDGITIEFFPNKTRMKPGKFGQIIKLPLGIHIKTGERAYFLDKDFNKITDVNYFLDNIAKYSLHAIKKVIAVNLENNDVMKEKKIDMDLSAYNDVPENILEVLKGCNLMRHLCQKAARTGYLTHFERLSVLYVFGHIGEEGKQFVHTVMAHTLNYQYRITERFIQRIPAKPISCIKLREQYKQITAESGCSCDFKRSKNCYPSPVLHVILQSSDLQKDITIPTSRSITAEKEKKIVDEINIHKKVQELAGRMLDMKKQKRSLDTSILKIEKEMEKIFDNAMVDCLEIESGMLVRRKREKGYEWLIEI